MRTLSNNKLDMMRSYSSIFSSTSFFKLLQNDDYSFINTKIERYDLGKIGKNINTYHDYIQYAYRELRKQYKNEYVYKNTFINNMLLNKYGVKDTIAINEFRVGNSIADIVMFNGTSKAFEIKTELDSEKRLSGQLNDYTKIFKECYIVTHESLIEKYLETDEKIGVIAIIKHNNSFKMREVRKATVSEDIDASVLIRSLRTQEYKNVVMAYFGQLPCVSNFQMFDECAFLMKQIPNIYPKLNLILNLIPHFSLSKSF